MIVFENLETETIMSFGVNSKKRFFIEFCYKEEEGPVMSTTIDKEEAEHLVKKLTEFINK